MNILIKTLSILTIILTVFVCALKPKMHANIVIYDSQYKLVENNENVTPTENTTKEEKVYNKETAYLPEVSITQKVIKKTPTQVIENQINNVQQVQVTKKELQKVQPIKQVSTQKQITTQTQVASQRQIVNTETKAKQNEEISWNIWRSNLQNQIMKDVNLPIIPQGTVFKFSFDVDKYGKISNVKTWSLTPKYTPIAIQYIAPAIRSYQGKNILNFPNESTRYTTSVAGGWRISNNTKFSTPQDYNDKERIER